MRKLTILFIIISALTSCQKHNIIKSYGYGVNAKNDTIFIYDIYQDDDLIYTSNDKHKADSVYDLKYKDALQITPDHNCVHNGKYPIISK